MPDTSHILRVLGAPFERWGNCRTACYPPTIQATTAFESSRHDSLRTRQEHPGDMAERATVVAGLSPEGDTQEREKETLGEEQQAAGSWQGAADAKRLAQSAGRDRTAGRRQRAMRRARSGTSAGVGRYALCAWRQASPAAGSLQRRGGAEATGRGGRREEQSSLLAVGRRQRAANTRKSREVDWERSEALLAELIPKG